MKDLYSSLLSGREQDSQRFWVIFGVMNVINGSLFGFVVSNLTPEPLKIVAAIIGIGLCVLWILGMLRMGSWVRWWEKKLEEFEAHYFSEVETTSPKSGEFLKEFYVFRNRAGAVKSGCSTRSLGVWIASIFIVGWVSLLLYASILLKCT